MNESVSTPKHISLLSPGIDDSYYIYQHNKSSMSMAPGEIPAQKTQLPMIINMPKTNHGGSGSHYVRSNSTVSDKSQLKKGTEYIEDDEG